MSDTDTPTPARRLKIPLPVQAFASKTGRRIMQRGLAAFAWALTGVRPIWLGCQPNGRQRIYFANHTSHGDFILIMTCLQRDERDRVHAAAAADYWGKTKLRRFIAEELLSSVLIERDSRKNGGNPLQDMLDVLAQGDSLIIFPEGRRNTDKELLEFKSGLYNLATARPDVELIPCWIENMSRVLPRGEILPVPLLCRVVFGAPIVVTEGEDRLAFLARARQAVIELNPRPARPAS